MNPMSAGQPLITLVGDVMLGGKVGDSLRQIGLERSAARISRLLHGSIVIGNLECPLSSTVPVSPFRPDAGGPNLRAAPSMANWLKEAGFHVLSLANNHAMDCGPEGLVETLDRLHESGLRSVGAGRNLAEATEPLVLRACGRNVAILAFGNGTPATRDAPGVAPFSSDCLVRAMARVPLDAEVTIVLMHAGLEFLEFPESWMAAFAEEALRAGADVVVGGHPHCLRGVLDRTEGFVAYSAGDFLSDTSDPDLLRDHIQRTALTRLGYPVTDTSLCRRGLVVDVYANAAGLIECACRPVVIGDDFLPREPDEPERALLVAYLGELSSEISTPNSEGSLRACRIEEAYRRMYVGRPTWRYWLNLPWRIGSRWVIASWISVRRWMRAWWDKGHGKHG